MLLLFLILPTSTLALIKTVVTGKLNDENDSDLMANLYGSNSDLITSIEKQEYGLTDDAIKDAIKQTIGETPDDVYFRSPTPWGDLYKTYGWTQVSRTTRPVDARLVSLTVTEGVVIKEEGLENNSSKNVEVDIALSKTVQNVLTSSWSNEGHETSEKLRVKFNLRINGNRVVRGYKSTWRKKGKGKIEDTLGSTSSVNMVLEPGQSVKVTLEAKKAVLTMEVDYESTLSGAVASNFDKAFKGHHFYNSDIDEILTVKSLPKERKVTQTLKYEFYFGDRLVVSDRLGSKLMTKEISRKSSNGDKKRTGLKFSVVRGSELKTFVDDDDGLNSSEDGKDSEEKGEFGEVAEIPLSLPKGNSTSV